MKLDEERIQAKTQFIEKNLSFLQQFANSSESDFVEDLRNFYSAVHALQISIEAMLDIFTHIVARLHLGATTDDRETLDLLLKRGLISQDHFQRYFHMNKFRNRVVHGYMDVDARKVHKMIQEELGDFQLFFDDVKQIINDERAKEKNNKKKKANNGK